MTELNNAKKEKMRPKVILTCFAGRRRNMDLLLAYTDKLHSMGLMDEMHIWDFSKDPKDGAWLSQAFQRAPILSTSRYEYINTGLNLRASDMAELSFKGHKDAHVMLTNAEGSAVAEISIGAYNNSCSFLRNSKQGEAICHRGGMACGGCRWRKLGISVGVSGDATVSLDGEAIMAGHLGGHMKFPLGIWVAGWNGSEEVQWILPDEDENNRPHPYARMFGVKNKNSWSEYYQHYTTQLYPNHVIIKSDDDIVFIDHDAFGRFIEDRTANENPILLFPSIVNNGVCAALQKSRGYLARELGDFKKENVMGRLWGDGRLCGSLHSHFVERHESWLSKARASSEILGVPIGDRVSINFFAILSKDLYVYQMLGHDDERDITVEVTRRLNRGHAISMNMTVSHLAFYKQRETGLNESRAINMYWRLSKKMTGRDGIRMA
jgi:hypothetical protein